MKKAQQHISSIASLNSLEANYQLLSRKALMKKAQQHISSIASLNRVHRIYFSPKNA